MRPATGHPPIQSSRQFDRCAKRKRGSAASAAVCLLAIALLGSGCSNLRVYRPALQQGNVITQQMVDSLKPGMTREQVAYVMGEPVVRNPFNDNRWDYVYTLQAPGYADKNALLSVFFEDGELSHFDSDIEPSDDADGETRDDSPDAADEP